MAGLDRSSCPLHRFPRAKWDQAIRRSRNFSGDRHRWRRANPEPKLGDISARTRDFPRKFCIGRVSFRQVLAECHAGMVTQRNVGRQAFPLRTVTDLIWRAWQAWQMGKKSKQRHFIRAWREFRNLSQEALAERMGIARSYISHIENGKRRYDQIFLESAADALGCAPADLIMRDPTESGSIWSIWDQITPHDREQAMKVLETFKKTG